MDQLPAFSDSFWVFDVRLGLHSRSQEISESIRTSLADYFTVES